MDRRYLEQRSPLKRFQQGISRPIYLADRRECCFLAFAGLLRTEPLRPYHVHLSPARLPHRDLLWSTCRNVLETDLDAFATPRRPASSKPLETGEGGRTQEA